MIHNETKMVATSSIAHMESSYVTTRCGQPIRRRHARHAAVEEPSRVREKSIVFPLFHHIISACICIAGAFFLACFSSCNGVEVLDRRSASSQVAWIYLWVVWIMAGSESTSYFSIRVLFRRDRVFVERFGCSSINVYMFSFCWG